MRLCFLSAPICSYVCVLVRQYISLACVISCYLFVYMHPCVCVEVCVWRSEGACLCVGACMCARVCVSSPVFYL